MKNRDIMQFVYKHQKEKNGYPTKASAKMAFGSFYFNNNNNNEQFIYQWV